MTSRGHEAALLPCDGAGKSFVWFIPCAAASPRDKPVIALAPPSSPEECFTPPSDPSELADMVARAATESDAWKDGIVVSSANRDWVTLRVNCRLLTAERLVTFFDELAGDLPEPDRDGLLLAFREILMNAMEHGGHFDPETERRRNLTLT